MTGAWQDREETVNLLKGTERPIKLSVFSSALHSRYAGPRTPPTMSQAISTRETRECAREVKFVIDPDTAARVRAWARARLSPDPYASGTEGDQYLTTSLYLDTDGLDVFNRRGSYGRSKYRIRRYGSSDVVFLERKMRTSSLLTKRRTIVALDSLRHLDEPAVDAGWPGLWFYKRIRARKVHPTAQVAYARTARVGAGAWGPMRLTLDEQLRAQPANGLVFEPAAGIPVLENQTILELKFRVEMPALFRQLVEEFTLAPAAISKYRLSVDALDLAGAKRLTA